MSAPTVEIVRDEGGDWTGLYIDGELIKEDHSFEAGDLLDLLEDECGPHSFDWKGTRYVDMTSRRLPAFTIDLDRCIEG